MSTHSIIPHTSQQACMIAYSAHKGFALRLFLLRMPWLTLPKRQWTRYLILYLPYLTVPYGGLCSKHHICSCNFTLINLFAGTKCSRYISPPNSTTVSVETLIFTDRVLLFYLQTREIADILQATQIKVTNYSCIFPSRGMHVLSGKSRIALSKMYANFKKGYKAGLLILHYNLRHEIKIIKIT